VNLFREETGIEALPQHGQWDHEIPLEEGEEPPFSPIYQMSEADLGTLREYIDENLKKGFIRPSNSPAGSPVLFVPKKDGKKRLCVDYRKLNAITVKDRYALPLADELRDRLSGAKVFTKLDLRGAYNLIRMKKGEEWKTAFRCRYGHFEYQVMPFGLTNAPATCMRMINATLGEYLDRICIAYLDDILVYSKTAKQHVEDVKKILMALFKAQLFCKPEKCAFHQEKVDFLGYVITPGGLSMDPSKVNTILEWEQPTNVKEVQSFLGFANFYRRFIKGYSAIAAPLTELTRKDKDFEWTTDAQDAFEQLKQDFTRAPILLTFDPEKQIVVETDSSDYALGAMLSQKGEHGK
jgi:Reverse transcriptase (RNA-dependent DNA polymerase)/RNase H-like domain found in reverse transcriptase